MKSSAAIRSRHGNSTNGTKGQAFGLILQSPVKNYAKVSFKTCPWLFPSGQKILMLGLLVGLAQTLAPAQALYVTANPGVAEISPRGDLSTFYSSPNFLTGLALDANGNLFVAGDYDSITKLSPVGIKSTFAGGLNPNGFNGLAFDSQGNLYVADDAILKFTPNGSKTTFASVSLPFGLAFDKAGNLFVAGQNGSEIIEYSTGGAESVFALGSGFSALAFDSRGNLFVTDFSSGGLYMFTPAGSESVFASGLAGPFGLAFDSRGNLFVSEYNANDIVEFTPSGDKSTFVTGLINPRYLAFEPAPEPATWLLMIVGLVGLARLGRGFDIENGEYRFCDDKGAAVRRGRYSPKRLLQAANVRL